MSKNGLKFYYYEVLMIIAHNQSILEWDVKNESELFAELNPTIIEQYNKFKEAYDAWYAFHENIEQNHKAGKLNLNEHNTLMKLIENRDNTRLTLIELSKPLN